MNAGQKAGLSAASVHTQMQAAEETEFFPEEKETVLPKTQEEDAEKEVLRKIVTRLMDDMGAKSFTELSEMIDKAEERKLISAHGLTEEAAKLFLSQQEKVRALRLAEAAAGREAVYAVLRQNPLFADIDGRKDMVEALILKTGLSPKEAYFALFAEERLQSLQKALDEKAAETEKKAKDIPALSGGEAPDGEKNIKLSEAENSLAKKAGMTPYEYAKYKFAY